MGGACLHLLISKWQWVQKIPSPNVRCSGVCLGGEHLLQFSELCSWVLMSCYLFTIQFGNEMIAVRGLLYIHNSKKPKSQLWMGMCLHHLISKWHWVRKIYVPTLDGGLSPPWQGTPSAGIVVTLQKYHCILAMPLHTEVKTWSWRNWCFINFKKR